MNYYFYSETKNNVKNNQYTVYQVEVLNDNIDIAERRARTKARQFNDTLAGGMFSESCLPYNFKKDYTVIVVPLSTRVFPYTKHDKFIINLIEAEFGR